MRQASTGPVGQSLAVTVGEVIRRVGGGGRVGGGRWEV